MLVFFYHFIATTPISKLSDTEAIWLRTIWFWTLIWFRNYLTPSLSHSEPIWFWIYLIPKLSDSETIFYQSYLIPSLSDAEPFWSEPIWRRYHRLCPSLHTSLQPSLWIWSADFENCFDMKKSTFNKPVRPQGEPLLHLSRRSSHISRANKMTEKLKFEPLKCETCETVNVFKSKL